MRINHKIYFFRAREFLTIVDAVDFRILQSEWTSSGYVNGFWVINWASLFTIAFVRVKRDVKINGLKTCEITDTKSIRHVYHPLKCKLRRSTGAYAWLKVKKNKKLYIIRLHTKTRCLLLNESISVQFTHKQYVTTTTINTLHSIHDYKWSYKQFGTFV